MGTPTDPPGAPDDVSFEELYRRDARGLIALAYGLSGSRMAAEELVHDAFLATAVIFRDEDGTVVATEPVA